MAEPALCRAVPPACRPAGWNDGHHACAGTRTRLGYVRVRCSQPEGVLHAGVSVVTATSVKALAVVELGTFRTASTGWVSSGSTFLDVIWAVMRAGHDVQLGAIGPDACSLMQHSGRSSPVRLEGA